jgi:hypothetical protein
MATNVEMANRRGMGSVVRRNKSMRLTVTGDVYERLERLAVTVGVPPSTLATMALGLYVAQQEKTLVITERMAERMADQLGGDMGAEMVKQLSLLTKGDQH